jgi:hypothetical protein
MLSIILLTLFLADPSDTPEHRAEAVAYLHTLQTPGGGFILHKQAIGEDELNPSLRLTRTAVRAFKMLGGKPADPVALEKFLKECHDPKSGGFSDRPGLPPDAISTSVALMTLVELKLPTEPYLDGALRFLGENTHDFEDIRMAAAGLEAVDKRIPAGEKWLKIIDAARNADGSYGSGPGRTRTTALYVVAQLRLGAKPESFPAVLKILREGQREDGGYGNDVAGASHLEACYRVMRAFSKLEALPDRPDELHKFVAACRNPDGGYGVQPGKPSTLQGTYYAAVVRNFLAGKK